MTSSSIHHVIQVGSLAVTFTLALMLSACGRDKQWDLTAASIRFGSPPIQLRMWWKSSSASIVRLAMLKETRYQQADHLIYEVGE